MSSFACFDSDLGRYIAGRSLIDHHAHGVRADELDDATFRQLISEANPDFQSRFDTFQTPIGMTIRGWCAPVLDLEPHCPPEAYLARRRELGAAEVNQRLIAATGLSHLLIDTGHLSDTVTSPADTVVHTTISVAEIVRVEAVAERVIASGAEGFVERFREEFDQRCAQAVGIKSIVAYRFGFDFDPARPTDAVVAAAATDWAATGGRVENETMLRFALWEAVDAAGRYGLPIQLHTAFGDDDIVLYRNAPSRLQRWLTQIPQDIAVCLLHCWPYHRHAAFLAAVLPGVYFDTGSLTSHAAPNYGQIFDESLDVAPFFKVLFSTDAFGLAELYFISARAFRLALTRTLTRWLDDGVVSLTDATGIVDSIAEHNARSIYPSLAP